MFVEMCRSLFNLSSKEKLNKQNQEQTTVLPGKVLPVLVEFEGDDDDGVYLEAHQILVGLMDRLRQHPDPEVQGAVAWAETALWG
jgi:hypothetical protein